jgi:hypothetical protein
MYKIKRFSIRPYASGLIKSSKEELLKGKNKWDIAKRLNEAKLKYEKSSRKVTSLNPIKMMRNSKDASDSSYALSNEISRILSK